MSALLVIAHLVFFLSQNVLKGLVPKPEVQRETHEAAELSGRPETCVLPRPEEDEGAGREAGGRGAGTLLLLWRSAVCLGDGGMIMLFYLD